MLINNATLEALRTGFKTLFQAGVKKAEPLYKAMTTVVPSSTRVETYGFLSDFPVFREWLGAKRVKSMLEKAYQLINRDFEATIGIHKNKIKDDNLGLYGPMVQGWGEDAAALNDRLAFEALALGHTKPCYDGQNYFDTDHPMGKGDTPTSNMSGDGAVQPWFLLDCSKPLKPILLQEREAPTFHMVTDPQDSQVFLTGEYLMGAEARAAAGYTYWQLGHRCTATLNEENYVAAKEEMAALTNDEGEPLAVKPTHLVVGTSNVAAARNLIDKANLAGGESNIYFKDVTLVEAPRLP
ncbi:MAG: hypothetical protein GC145_18600 [Caulobacter sp.]|nr:hypothetical protein [Caulobacter sp.]